MNAGASAPTFSKTSARTPFTALPGMSETWSTHTVPDPSNRMANRASGSLAAGLSANVYFFQSPPTFAMCASS